MVIRDRAVVSRMRGEVGEVNDNVEMVGLVVMRRRRGVLHPDGVQVYEAVWYVLIILHSVLSNVF